MFYWLTNSILNLQNVLPYVIAARLIIKEHFGWSSYLFWALSPWFAEFFGQSTYKWGSFLVQETKLPRWKVNAMLFTAKWMFIFFSVSKLQCHFIYRSADLNVRIEEGDKTSLHYIYIYIKNRTILNSLDLLNSYMKLWKSAWKIYAEFS